MLGQQYIILQHNPRKNIFLRPKPLNYVDRHTGITLKPAWAWAIILALALPIFRSGLKGNLTFVEWVWNHTIFNDTPEYIPQEDYEQIFKER